MRKIEQKALDLAKKRRAQKVRDLIRSHLRKVDGLALLIIFAALLFLLFNYRMQREESFLCQGGGPGKRQTEIIVFSRQIWRLNGRCQVMKRSNHKNFQPFQMRPEQCELLISEYKKGGLCAKMSVE